MSAPLIILLIGLTGILSAWALYRLASRPWRRGDDPAFHPDGIDTGLLAYGMCEFLVLVGLVAVAGGLFWVVLSDWRAALAMLTGALCAASAGVMARRLHLARPVCASPAAQPAHSPGVALSLFQGGLLLSAAACLYLLLAFDPAHYTDFTGFALGAIVATLLARLGGGALQAAVFAPAMVAPGERSLRAAIELSQAGTDWFQPVVANTVATFALAVLLPAATTMLIGPQMQLLLLPLALVAAAYLSGVAGIAILLGAQATRLALFVSGAVFLLAGFGVMALLHIYWQLWLCLAAGVVGGLVLLLVRTRGRVQSGCLALGAILAVVLSAWLMVPGQAQAYGVSIAAFGLLAGFSLNTTLTEAHRRRELAALALESERAAIEPAIHHTRLSLSAGWLVVMLLSFVSVQFIYTRASRAAFEWGDPDWMAGALLGLAGVCVAVYVGLRAYLMTAARWHRTQDLSYAVQPALAGAALCGALVMLVTGSAGIFLGPWALGATLPGAILACLLLAPLLLDRGGVWEKVFQHVIAVDPRGRTAVAGALQPLMALMACTAHLVAQVV